MNDETNFSHVPSGHVIKIKLKTLKEATELIENMSASDHAILRDRTHQPTKK